MQQEGTRDLGKLLAPRMKTSWKSAPDPSWLSGHMGTLMCGLFGVCSNGVVASKKLRGALQKLHAEEGRMNFGRKHDQDFFDYIDEQVRIAASQFRDLKKCPDGYRRCAKKASEDEMNGIKKVLDLLILEGNDKEAEAMQSSQPVVPGMAASSEDFLTPVFSKVLQKKSSEPESPQVARSRDMAAPASLALVPAPSAANGSGSGRPLLRRQMAQLQLEEDEEKELLCWMSQKVPETKKKGRAKRNRILVAKSRKLVNKLRLKLKERVVERMLLPRGQQLLQRRAS